MDDKSRNVIHERWPALSILLALMLAFLPATLVLAMFTFFKGRNVPAMALLGEGLFSLACCSAPWFLLRRRYPVLAVIIFVLFIPINGLVAFFFGCTAMLSAR